MLICDPTYDDERRECDRTSEVGLVCGDGDHGECRGSDRGERRDSCSCSRCIIHEIEEDQGEQQGEDGTTNGLWSERPLLALE